MTEKGSARPEVSVWRFEYGRLGQLAGVHRMEWVVCTLLALGAAAADATMLGLLVPLGSGSAGVERFWHSQLVKRLMGNALPAPPDATAGFFWLAGVMFVAGVVKNAFTHAHYLKVGWILSGIAERLANLMFSRFLRFGKAWFDRRSIGGMAAVMDFRFDVVAAFGTVMTLTSTLLVLAGYLTVMMTISWRLTLMAIAVFPLINLASRTILDRTAEAARRSRSAEVEIAAQLHEVLGAIPLFQSMGRERLATGEFEETTRQLRESGHRSWKLLGVSARLQDLASLASLLVMLALALGMEKNHGFEPFTLLVFFFIARQSQPMLAAFPEKMLEIAERLPRCEDLLTIFDEGDKFEVAGGTEEFGGLREGIEMRGLTFGYPEGGPVLRDLSFVVRKGEMTALVGPSGSGKTTMASLLMRFYQVPAGMIWIDGKDIRDYTVESLRRCFAMVSQDTVLLNESLRFNLLFGAEGAVSEAELEAVVEEARLRDVVEMLPGGLEGKVGERGARLSGGQRQRIAIARALLRRAPVLILDEATSGLDSITELLVQEAIANALRHATGLVIAHRFATIQLADHVVVLNEGRVVQQGTVTELLDEPGLFREMSEKQMFV